MFRVLSRIDQANKYCFSRIVQHTKNDKFPYKFGGIPLKNHNVHQEMIMKRTFGDDILEGFKGAYLSTLGALQENDQEFLTNILEPRLMNGFLPKKCTLVHQNSPVEIRLHRTFLVMGHAFERKEGSKLIKMKEEQQHGLQMYMDSGMGMGGGMGMGMGMGMGSATSLNFLMGIEVYFRSAAKLITSSTSQSQIDQDEAHMLQFQIANKLSFTTLLGLMTKIQTSSGNLSIEDLMKPLVGSQFEWKVGDVDGILNRNLQIAKV